jgi:hypothetical protein
MTNSIPNIVYKRLREKKYSCDQTNDGNLRNAEYLQDYRYIDYSIPSKLIFTIRQTNLSTKRIIVNRARFGIVDGSSPESY